MKIDARHAHIQQALERGLDATRLRELIESTGATPADVREVLEALGDRFSGESRRSVERLLSQAGTHALTASPAGADAAPGLRVHDLRARRHQPWWGAVQADPLPRSLHPEPARDVEVHGERFSKDDVASLLRQLARA